jgi:hypothetical protein
MAVVFFYISIALAHLCSNIMGSYDKWYFYFKEPKEFGERN